ncbi:MAG TPA: substrate-binding and VWA domain-containing protein [Actinophytocola sp.]|uniref:substrate-binding and VWA domain-containing protein n=1 Tax=Actinophytocola sp. TaxID=1872138 RepID=UPI002DDD9F15|nr:substrate-binding and VWA domain-containing protein [Actinophytocola sp.]HEV2783754.1 substrate-binding and VWA domain-containing protein [Actinophytocola sp.]
MGRHSPADRRGTRTPVLLLSVLLVAVLVGWFTFDLLRDQLAATSCDSTTTLNVAAAPEIAPTVTQIARAFAKQACYAVAVSSRESTAIVEALAVSDGTERPDVWIPESTMWLQRAQDKGAWNTPVSGSSIATSPVVLALTDAAAGQLGWPGTKLTWAQVIGPDARSFTVGMPDPARDPVGMSLLFGLRELIKGTPDPGAASTAAMRRLSPNTESGQSELFARLPGGSSPGEPLAAFPTSETALLRQNARQSEQLVAVYAEPAVPALDYPYVVLPESSESKRQAAGAFLDRLLRGDSADQLAAAGFRTPDGKALRDRSRSGRVSAAPMPPAPVPDVAEVEQVLNAWAAVNLSGRLQVLLDVSGSMNETVPGTGQTRMEITIQAATAGIGLFKPTTRLGLWLFSTRLDGDRDYKELLGMRTVSEHLAAGGLDTLRSVRAAARGSTALYDAVLAAYQDARQNWEAGRINTVIVLTDGKDDNASDIGLDQLLAELGRLQDGRRPLKIIGIGIGPDVDPAELKTIAEATGGEAFTTPDPTKIPDVFYAALSKMLCQPPQCQPGAGAN